MDELRKNQNVIIETRSKTQIEAIIFDYTFDRVLLEIRKEFIPEASKIRELEELTVTVDTHLGLKKMSSCVISAIDKENKLLIENNPAFIVITKREYSRVKCFLKLNVTYKGKQYFCTSANISGNGIGFNSKEVEMIPDEEIEIEFSLDDEQPPIKTNANIVSVVNNYIAAQYKNIDPKDQDRIVKYVFTKSTMNNKWS